jgi:glycosyltransferase involved in cell wall biosynthesis
MSTLLALWEKLPSGLRNSVKALPGSEWLKVRVAGTPKLPPIASGERRAVVYLPTWARWDVMRQRPQYLLAAFAAAGYDVYFVDPRESTPRSQDGVRIVTSIRRVPAGGVILYVHFAPLRHMFERFDDAVVVYDLLDDLSIYDSSEEGLPKERRVTAHHPHVMKEAAVVTVSNEVLLERHQAERDDLILVPNGVDVVRFSRPQPRPADLGERNANRPVIGYHGAIAEWFDFDLLTSVATARPDWDFVLVGPVDPAVAGRAAALEALPNVRSLGERPSGEMPAYVQAFDVGAIWFQVNTMTEGVTPLKMYEYLAAGVPCVSTPLPACVAETAVVTAADPDGFVEALEEALSHAPGGSSQSARDEIARLHSWESHLQPVLDRLAAEGLDRVR